MQRLITKELAESAPRPYETDGQGTSAVAVAHFFSNANGWDWYLTELDPDTGDAFGLVFGFERELGYFNLHEMEEVNEKFGFEAIERDLHWEPTTLAEVILSRDSRLSVAKVEGWDSGETHHP